MKNPVYFLILPALLVLVSGCGRSNGSPSLRNNESDDFIGEIHSAEVQAQGRAIATQCEGQVPLATKCNVLIAPEGPRCADSGSLPIDRDGYTLSREADGFHLGLRIHLYLPGVAPNRADVVLDKVRSCVPKIADIWSRYGLHLDLRLDRDANPAQYSPPDFAIQLFDRQARSNSRNYYFSGETAFELGEFCKVVLHETGHLLGLPDEYADVDVPERKFISTEKRPWSVMADNFHVWQLLDFYPRHVRAVLAPFCHLN